MNDSEEETIKQLKRLPWDIMNEEYENLDYFSWMKFVSTSGWTDKEFNDERFKRIVARYTYSNKP